MKLWNSAWSIKQQFSSSPKYNYRVVGLIFLITPLELYLQMSAIMQVITLGGCESMLMMPLWLKTAFENLHSVWAYGINHWSHYFIVTNSIIKICPSHLTHHNYISQIVTKYLWLFQNIKAASKKGDLLERWSK